MKLQPRLALIVAIAASIAIFLSASAFWFLAVDSQRQAVDDQLLRSIEQPRQFAGRIIDDQRGRPGRGPAAADIGERRLFALIRIVRNGEVIIDDGLPPFTGTEPTLETLTIDGERYRMASTTLGNQTDGAVIQVARNIEDGEASIARLRQRMILAGILGIGLAGVLGALTATRIARPIRRVSDAAAALAAQPGAAGSALPRRIEVDRADEIGELATSFNQMLGALEVSRDQQERLIGDASHELRTPLTSLRLKVDLLNSAPDLDQDQRQSLIADSAHELERLSDLVNELVALATDPSATEEEVVEVDLGALASDVVRVRERSSGRSIAVDIEEAAMATVRPQMVTRAISNLVDNAIKYSPADALIFVSVAGHRIEVRDHGEGFDPADLNHVFDRFYRSPVARTRPGNGIGLAIVAKVAELHGGDVWARNATSQDPDGAIGAVVGFSVSHG